MEVLSPHLWLLGFQCRCHIHSENNCPAFALQYYSSHLILSMSVSKFCNRSELHFCSLSTRFPDLNWFGSKLKSVLGVWEIFVLGNILLFWRYPSEIYLVHFKCLWSVHCSRVQQIQTTSNVDLGRNSTHPLLQICVMKTGKADYVTQISSWHLLWSVWSIIFRSFPILCSSEAFFVVLGCPNCR